MRPGGRRWARTLARADSTRGDVLGEATTGGGLGPLRHVRPGCPRCRSSGTAAYLWRSKGLSRAPPGGADRFERGLRRAALHSRARGGAVISTAKDPGGTRGLTVVFGPLTVAHDLTGERSVVPEAGRTCRCRSPPPGVAKNVCLRPLCAYSSNPGRHPGALIGEPLAVETTRPTNEAGRPRARCYGPPSG